MIVPRVAVVALALVLVAGTAGCGSVFGGSDGDAPVSDASAPASSVPTPPVTPSPEAATDVSVDEAGFYLLEPDEFDELYRSVVLPGAEELAEPPSIYDDPELDAYIVGRAEDRGYRLQRVATGTLTSLDGYLTQPLVAESWAALRAEAGAVGIEMLVVSGIRTVDDQRFLFREAMAERGATDRAVILSGGADAVIDEVLSQRSLPGYSKHHSGYAIDVTEAGLDFRTFEDTEAFVWLSADNYRNAKRFGFVPSYPPDAGPQGPDPEPWEYVWVGPEAVRAAAG